MATIRKRQNKWQVQVRRNGSQIPSQTFHRKSDAEAWARQMEMQADLGGFKSDIRCLAEIKLSDMILRYLDEIVPKKKSKLVEQFILGAILRDKVANRSLSILNSQHFASFRDERLKHVAPVTVKRELGLLHHMLNIARTEWGIPLPNNPVQMIQIPAAGKPRNRRLEPGEFEALQKAVAKTKAEYLWPLVELAIQTGMRRGELLKAKWRDLDLQARKLTLLDTKNGDDRSIPLTNRAVEILSELPRSDDRIFPVSPVAVRQSWDRLRKRAGLEDLHFHDLRHEAISRFFEMGLSVPEVALISGHRDYRMLARYTHLRAEDVVRKLI